MRESIYLKDLSAEKLKNFVDSFDTVLSDCDGVLWHDTRPVPGASDVMNSFKKLGKRVFYVTNNSTKTREEFVEKCQSLNFPVDSNSILSTGYLAAKYLQGIDFKKKVYIVGSAGIAKELDKVGIKHFGVGPDPLVNDDLAQSISNFQPDPEVGAVVVGFDLHFNYLKILKAATYLKSNDVLFVATNTDEQFPADEFIIPGTGSLVKAIETCSGRTAIKLGKPEPFVSEMLMKNYNIVPERTLMIGDRANTDILLGTRCGFQTLLVLTGVTNLEQLNLWKLSTKSEEKELLPSVFTDSIADLLSTLQ